VAVSFLRDIPQFTVVWIDQVRRHSVSVYLAFDKHFANEGFMQFV